MPLVAADIAVPLPFNTPVILVEIVMAGVDVAVATVPAKPLALATVVDVTVPPAVLTADVGIHWLVLACQDKNWPLVGTTLAVLTSLSALMLVTEYGAETSLALAKATQAPLCAKYILPSAWLCAIAP